MDGIEIWYGRGERERQMEMYNIEQSLRLIKSSGQ